MIYYIPIEDIEERYSIMMNQSIMEALPKDSGFIYPSMSDFPFEIETGQFLDTNKTIVFKARQIEYIAKMFYERKVKDGDVFLVADIFFPGIESIKYMAELQDILVHIFGFNHAGRSDENDFVKKLSAWADSSEAGYLQCCDAIFVGSNYHGRNIKKYFKYNNTYTTGIIWNLNFVQDVYKPYFNKQKEPFVIWPHRLCEEKGINELRQYAEITNKKIIITSSSKQDPGKINLPNNVSYVGGLTKAQYYEHLSTAEFYLSTAHQETFGYTLLEAIFYRCKIAVPNRASYPEMVPRCARYDSIDEVDYIFEKEASKLDMSWTERWNGNVYDVLDIVERVIADKAKLNHL